MVNLIKRPSRDSFLSPIQDMFDNFFDDFFTERNGQFVSSTKSYPKIDIKQEDGKLSVVAAVPGAKPENIKAEMLPGNILKICGEMSGEYKSPEGAEYYVKELHKTRFERQIQLPDDLVGDPDAELKNGLLTLSWKYKQTKEVEKTKLINIK